jgi:hypothetical protein
MSEYDSDSENENEDPDCDEQGNASEEDHCEINKDLNFLKSVQTRSVSHIQNICLQCDIWLKFCKGSNSVKTIGHC